MLPTVVSDPFFAGFGWTQVSHKDSWRGYWGSRSPS